MKQLFFLFLVWVLVFLSFQQGWAQRNKPDHRFSIGVKGGSSFSFITRTNSNYARESPPRIISTQGYTGGLALQYFPEPNFALQLEMYYTQKGWREIFIDTAQVPQRYTDSLFYEVTLNYLEVPITAHGYIGKKNVRIFLEAGMYLGYLHTFDTRQEPSIADGNVTYLMRTRTANQLDIGIRGAGGFEVATKVGTFQLGTSFSYGLGSVIDRNLTEIPNMLQNQTFTVTLGYFVEFGKSKQPSAKTNPENTQQ